jgi:hypothetical protein
MNATSAVDSLLRSILTMVSGAEYLNSWHTYSISIRTLLSMNRSRHLTSSALQLAKRSEYILHGMLRDDKSASIDCSFSARIWPNPGLAMMQKLVVKRVLVVGNHLNRLGIEEQPVESAMMRKLVMKRVPVLFQNDSQ